MNLNDFTKDWNNKWRYDYWWRQKHNIAFGSEQHRQMNPIDVAFEYFENKLVIDVKNDLDKKEENEKLLKQGTWIKEKESIITDELWDKMDWKNF